MIAGELETLIFRLEGVESALLNAEETIGKLQKSQDELLPSYERVIDASRFDVTENVQIVQGWINQLKELCKC